MVIVHKNVINKVMLCENIIEFCVVFVDFIVNNFWESEVNLPKWWAFLELIVSILYGSVASSRFEKGFGIVLFGSPM